jgi:flagellar basal body-associated protein FliL
MIDDNQASTENKDTSPEDIEETSANEEVQEKKGFLQYINPLFIVPYAYTHHKILTLISGATFLLLIMASTIYFIYLSPSTTIEKENTEVIQYNTNYYPLPELKLRIQREDDNFGYLVIGLTLKLPGNTKIEDYRKLEPEILDVLHTYLSSISVESFASSTTTSFTSPVGLERIRQNITRRLNTILSPLMIESVLFRKLITQ